MRGHGRSHTPPGPYAMGALIHDVERVMAHQAMRDAVVVGVSIGGMIAQGLATKRLDLVRAMVLSNTATRIGTPPQWQARIEAVAAGGIAAIAEGTLERWFGRNWRTEPSLPRFRAIMEATPPEGWMGPAAAIAGTDFYTPTAALTLPTLAIAGANDGSTPPDLVRETADLIRGSQLLPEELEHTPPQSGKLARKVRLPRHPRPQLANQQTNYAPPQPSASPSPQHQQPEQPESAAATDQPESQETNSCAVETL
jgi:3-oxoadipate enol-lactonase